MISHLKQYHIDTKLSNYNLITTMLIINLIM